MPDKPVPVRDCVDCRRADGMCLQNVGLTMAHYVCTHCGASLTIPPEKLAIPLDDDPESPV